MISLSWLLTAADKSVLFVTRNSRRSSAANPSTMIRDRIVVNRFKIESRKSGTLYFDPNHFMIRLSSLASSVLYVIVQIKETSKSDLLAINFLASGAFWGKELNAVVIMQVESASSRYLGRDPVINSISLKKAFISR